MRGEKSGGLAFKDVRTRRHWVEMRHKSENSGDFVHLDLNSVLGMQQKILEEHKRNCMLMAPEAITFH